MATPAGPGAARTRTDNQPLVLYLPAKTQGPFYALWSNIYIYIYQHRRCSCFAYSKNVCLMALIQLAGGTGSFTCGRANGLCSQAGTQVLPRSSGSAFSTELALRGCWVPWQKVPSSAESAGEAGYLRCAGAESGLSPKLIARVAENLAWLCLAAIFIISSCCCNVSARSI